MTEHLTRLLRALRHRNDKPGHLGRRFIVLAAAIGVPAFAAPAEWTFDGIGAADSDPLQLAMQQETMPFESVGMSFPGSAFYYLEDAPQAPVALPSLDPNETQPETGHLGMVLDAGPVARSFASAGTGLDRARALQCLAQAVYYEAASESEAGQRAVAQVVLNRVANRAWPSSVCGVVYQGSQRSTGCQFTFTCDGSLTRKPSRKGWDRAMMVAAHALAGDVYEPIGLATHYHTNWVNPYWAKTLDLVGTIGAHRFYRTRGASGHPSAFTTRYSGHEIATASLTLRTAQVPVASESVAPTRSGPMPASSAITGTPAPSLATPAKPVSQVNSGYGGAGQVKAEYASAGRWLDDQVTGKQ